MKIRNGYVSNSSSTSFVIMMFEEFAHLTAENIMDVLLELSNFSLKKEDCCVYDLQDPKQKSSVDEDLKDVLKDWPAIPSSRGPNGKVELSPADHGTWEELLSCLFNCKDKSGYHYWLPCTTCTTLSSILEDIDNGTLLQKYDRKKDRTVYKKVPDKAIRMFKDIWNECRLVTNYEVMMDDNSKFFIHFDENDVYKLNCMTDEDGYESEPYTKDRFCEIISKHMISKNLLPEDFDWRKLSSRVGAYCMHEG